jgi:hypothetical protein
MALHASNTQKLSKRRKNLMAQDEELAINN